MQIIAAIRRRKRDQKQIYPLWSSPTEHVLHRSAHRRDVQSSRGYSAKGFNIGSGFERAAQDTRTIETPRMLRTVDPDWTARIRCRDVQDVNLRGDAGRLWAKIFAPAIERREDYTSW